MEGGMATVEKVAGCSRQRGRRRNEAGTEDPVSVVPTSSTSPGSLSQLGGPRPSFPLTHSSHPPHAHPYPVFLGTKCPSTRRHAAHGLCPGAPRTPGVSLRARPEPALASGGTLRIQSWHLQTSRLGPITTPQSSVPSSSDWASRDGPGGAVPLCAHPPRSSAPKAKLLGGCLHQADVEGRPRHPLTPSRP